MPQIKVVSQFELEDGQVAQNVSYGETTGAINANLVSELGATLQDVWTTFTRVLYSSATKWVGLLVYRWIVGEGWVLVDEYGASVPGTLGTDQLPAGVSVLLQQGVVDSSRRGRKFLPPPAESFSSGSGFAAGVITPLLQWGNLVTDPLNLPTAGNIVWGLYADALGSGTFRSFTGSLILNLEQSYQRRRREGVGI